MHYLWNHLALRCNSCPMRVEVAIRMATTPSMMLTAQLRYPILHMLLLAFTKARYTQQTLLIRFLPLLLVLPTRLA